jgi:hypothetical protein
LRAHFGHAFGNLLSAEEDLVALVGKRRHAPSIARIGGLA